MKLTKAMVREAWEKEPGFAHDGHSDGAPNCAVQSIRAYTQGVLKYGSTDSTLKLFPVLTELNDFGFSSTDGVTPEERRDCMLAMLDAGAFDAWLEA